MRLAGLECVTASELYGRVRLNKNSCIIIIKVCVRTAHRRLRRDIFLNGATDSNETPFESRDFSPSLVGEAVY